MILRTQKSCFGRPFKKGPSLATICHGLTWQCFDLKPQYFWGRQGPSWSLHFKAFIWTLHLRALGPSLGPSFEDLGPFRAFVWALNSILRPRALDFKDPKIINWKTLQKRIFACYNLSWLDMAVLRPETTVFLRAAGKGGKGLFDVFILRRLFKPFIWGPWALLWALYLKICVPLGPFFEASILFKGLRPLILKT